ncbi:hypothetical protein KSF_084990 [Reticulibacter mediterranei]|uniref:Uncharacterized protein n=1 Tax=Reticulibacter mediterranei TaxID=2778369 RepID=A0A8J3J072_9CHLR|nr:hypothetical protein KSF_084990 [Reticulibacter mediterranei]
MGDVVYLCLHLSLSNRSLKGLMVHDFQLGQLVHGKPFPLVQLQIDMWPFSLQVAGQFIPMNNCHGDELGVGGKLPSLYVPS